MKYCCAICAAMMDDPAEGEVRNESGVALCVEHWARINERANKSPSLADRFLVLNAKTDAEKYIAYSQRLALVGSAT
jgi:hypothetical protein